MIFIKNGDEFSYEIALDKCSYEIILCFKEIKKAVTSGKFDAEDVTIYEKLFENASYADIEVIHFHQAQNCNFTNEIVKRIKEIRAFTKKHEEDNLCDKKVLRNLFYNEGIDYSEIYIEGYLIKKEYLLKAMEHEAFNDAYRIGTTISSIYFENFAVNIISIMFYDKDRKQIGRPLYFVEEMI